jgi:peptidyl-prolyl cis-trans isomerase SurA
MPIALWLACLLLAVAASAAQGKSRVVEEIIARVNNQIITRGELERSRVTLRSEVQQDCQACTPAQIDERLAPLEKNLLRDLIDNLLLIQRAQDLGISVDTEVVRRLDEIRQQNNIPSMEDLEKAVRAAGRDYEDFRAEIRNEMYRQEVMRREVGARIIPDKAEIQKYYDEHLQQFVRPEQVYVREIFVNTEGKTEAEKTALQAKAEGLLARVKSGEDFGELAKRFSDGSTAKTGGDLGMFQRGVLAPVLDQAVFQLNRNEVTPVIPLQTGFEILQVIERYVAGQQPLEKVEIEITNTLYSDKMRPALRAYLDEMRQQSYIEIKAGYVDTSGVASRPIEEVPAAPQANAGGDTGRNFLRFGR